MTLPQAVVAAAALIAATVVLADRPSVGAEEGRPGRYAIAATGTDGLRAWRLDTATGRMTACSALGNVVTCVEGAKP